MNITTLNFNLYLPDLSFHLSEKFNHLDKKNNVEQFPTRLCKCIPVGNCERERDTLLQCTFHKLVIITLLMF